MVVCLTHKMKASDGFTACAAFAASLRKFNNENAVIYLQTLQSCIGAHEWRGRWLQQTMAIVGRGGGRGRGSCGEWATRSQRKRGECGR